MMFIVVAPSLHSQRAQASGSEERTFPEDLVVYDDDLRPPWSDASWNALVSYGNTEQARTETTSIKVELTVAWGFLGMHHGE